MKFIYTYGVHGHYFTVKCVPVCKTFENSSPKASSRTVTSRSFVYLCKGDDWTTKFFLDRWENYQISQK